MVLPTEMYIKYLRRSYLVVPARMQRLSPMKGNQGDRISSTPACPFTIFKSLDKNVTFKSSFNLLCMKG